MYKEILSLEIRLKFPSLNNRLSQRELTEIKNRCKQEIIRKLREERKVIKIRNASLLVCLRYNFTHDVDNSILGVKFFNDALIEAGIIKKDSVDVVEIVALVYDKTLDFGVSVFQVYKI
jgi:hypothetical protein